MKNTRIILRKKVSETKTFHELAISLHGLYCNVTGFLHTLPDFYIIGTAKGGTSSLFDYLIQHPDIISPIGKELHYFEELYHRGKNWYKVCFPLRTYKLFKKDLITGEATPRYLDHPHVPTRIKNLTPNAKFIIMLRNPIERAFSHYNMVINNRRNFESLSFEDAISKEKERIDSEYKRMVDDPNYHSHNYYIYGYLDRGIYVKKIKNWLSVFPRKQFLFIKSEEFFENPDKIYQNVLEFLGRKNFHLNNYNPKKVGKYKKREINPATRRMLEKFFEPYNEELSKLLKIDFNWN